MHDGRIALRGQITHHARLDHRAFRANAFLQTFPTERVPHASRLARRRRSARPERHFTGGRMKAPVDGDFARIAQEANMDVGTRPAKFFFVGH